MRSSKLDSRKKGQRISYGLKRELIIVYSPRRLVIMRLQTRIQS